MMISTSDDDCTVCSLHRDSSDHDDDHEMMRDEITMMDGWVSSFVT